MFNPCKLCNALCCKEYLITITSFDVLRVIEKTDKKAEDFVVLSNPPINPDNDTILECYNDERSEYVLTFKSHPCYFLGKDNQCTIYESAPLSCRLYPHNSNEKMIRRALCPTISKFLFKIRSPCISVQKYKNQMLNYKEIVRKWNSKHGKKEDCLEFLLNESKTYS